MTAIELRQERKRLSVEAEGILAKAESEKRGLLAIEQERYDAVWSDINGLKARIDNAEKLAELRGEMGSPIHEQKHVQSGQPAAQGKDSPELRAFFAEFGRSYKIELKPEKRALSADSSTEGGYTTAPKFVADLIKAVDDQSTIRKLAKKFAIPDASSLGFPSLDADPADADWTTEVAAASADSTMAFGKRELKPHPLSKLIKVSRKLMRQSMLPIDALVRDRFAYKFAITENKAFLTGSGAGKPLGVMTASNDGIPTSRDVSTDNTTTSITADGLMNALYSLKEQHAARASFIFHRDALKQIRKLKDGSNNYLWQPGLAGSQPDTILGRPFYLDENMSATFTTGLYVGIVGNFDFYWIADAMSMELQRLEELYAETNQVGFIARMDVDGAPVLAEAFARVKLA